MGDLQAVRLFLKAVAVVGALAGLGIEQVAGHVGEHQLLGVLVDQLVQAALAAAVAQGLPLRHGHLLQALRLPKWGVLHGFCLLRVLLHEDRLTQYTDKRVVIRPMARFFKVGGGFAYELPAGTLEQIYDIKVTRIVCMQQDRFTQSNKAQAVRLAINYERSGDAASPVPLPAKCRPLSRHFYGTALLSDLTEREAAQGQMVLVEHGFSLPL